MKIKKITITTTLLAIGFVASVVIIFATSALDKTEASTISKDNGAVWEKYDTDEVDAKEFAKWLLINDPIPGYSMEEVQTRLANGAEVKYLVFENVKEMYFIIDRNGVQIELVQPEKISSVLIDSQRMMITSAISAQMLKSFYDLLVSNNILSETHAEQDYSERIKYIEKNLPNFILTK